MVTVIELAAAYREVAKSDLAARITASPIAIGAELIIGAADDLRLYRYDRPNPVWQCLQSAEKPALPRSPLREQRE